MAAWLMVTALLVPLLRLSPSIVSSVGRPRQTSGALMTGYFGGWRVLRAAVAGRLEPDARVVSSVPLAVTYYLHRPAYHLREPRARSTRSDGRSDGHWERRYHLGEQPVRTAEQMAALMADGRPIWVVVEPWRWETGRLDRALGDLVRSRCGEVTLPEGAALLAFSCPASNASRRSLSRLAPAAGIVRASTGLSSPPPAPRPPPLR